VDVVIDCGADTAADDSHHGRAAGNGPTSGSGSGSGIGDDTDTDTDTSTGTSAGTGHSNGNYRLTVAVACVAAGGAVVIGSPAAVPGQLAQALFLKSAAVHFNCVQTLVSV
jgi:hypothetical protein